jgi:hypothetical protein
MAWDQHVIASAGACQRNRRLGIRNALLLGIATAASCSSFGQKQSAPLRQVFKCDVEGKVVYSDTPCNGAKRDDEQMAQMTRQRRAKLSEQSRTRCAQLDQTLPAAERVERNATKEDRARTQALLLLLRQEYVELRC